MFEKFQAPTMTWLLAQASNHWKGILETKIACFQVLENSFEELLRDWIDGKLPDCFRSHPGQFNGFMLAGAGSASIGSEAKDCHYGLILIAVWVFPNQGWAKNA